MKLAAVVLLAPLLYAQQRPKILGVAHINLGVADLEKSRAFYRDFLGYQEPFSLTNPDGSTGLAFIKVNERQYIELSPKLDPATDRLRHISIETDDAEAMRLYLASRGVKVPASVPKGRSGNSNFNIKDPDDHTVEIVQYEPAGWSVREKGKYMGDARISKRILHLGILVGALEPAMQFYGGVLGFQEIWRGSKDGKVLSWVNMKVPDGTDYLEFMLYDKLPAPDKRGTAHHIALEVPDIAKSVAILEANPYRRQYAKTLEIRTGTNRKRQMNLYDPDGTRIELMEPQTVDGKPAPPATAPPPGPQ